LEAHARAASRSHETIGSTLMTLEEVAEYLRFHPSTVYRLAREGKLPAVKVGSQWRFHRDALEDWLRANTTGGNSSTQS